MPVRGGLARDVSDRKRAEEALRASEERFRGTFEHAAVGIAHIDAESRCLRANQKMCEILGCSSEELVGKTVPEVTHPDDLAPNLSLFGALMRGELPTFTMEKRFPHKDGSIVSTYLTVSLQRDEAGKPAYAIVMVQDISELKRLEGELRRAKEAAEAANRAKDEFLANVSHEIRTPMNAILGMTELALDTPLAEDQRQFLRTVKSAADNLLGILNDLLDFSKIEAGKLELDPADFSLRDAGRHPADVGDARPQERTGAGQPRAAGRARRPDRRRRPAAPGVAQSGRQRHQVHRGGRGGASGSRPQARRRRRRRSGSASSSATPASASRRKSRRRSSEPSSRRTARPPGDMAAPAWA